MLVATMIYVGTNIQQDLTDYAGSVGSRMDWYPHLFLPELSAAFHFQF